jgi:hypothetical protein
MKSRKSLFLTLCLVMLTALRCVAQASPAPRINGTFIQSFLVNDWDDARWQQELVMLKRLGMDYLIFTTAYSVDAAGHAASLYPSSLTPNQSPNNLIEACLRNAQKAGMKVFIGLNFNERWWRVDYDAEWLFAQMELGNRVAEELVELYKAEYPDAMYGWYWVWEVDNATCTTPELQAVLANALNVNLDYLAKLTPGMPLMLSPYMNHRQGTAEACGAMWRNVFAQTRFREGDIFAPQDCCGAGGLEVSMLPQWFGQLQSAADSKPELRFWANVELFDQRDWSSAPMERVAAQLQAVAPYVGNIICFAYSHYYSPYQVDPIYHEAYRRYLEGLHDSCEEL